MAALLGRSSEIVIETSSKVIAAGVRLVEKVPVIVVNSASIWLTTATVTKPAPTVILVGAAAVGLLVLDIISTHVHSKMTKVLNFC